MLEKAQIKRETVFRRAERRRRVQKRILWAGSLLICVSFILAACVNYRKIYTILEEDVPRAGTLVPMLLGSLEEQIGESYIGESYIGEFEITGYCICDICCGAKEIKLTKSGTVPKPDHTIAADPSILPMGTRVLIDGTVYTVEDTGGLIKGNRVDIFFGSHEEAVNFGRHKSNVYLMYHFYNTDQ